MTNGQITAQAREALQGHWGDAIAGVLIYSLMVSAANGAFPLGLVIGGPLSLGLAIFSLNIIRKKEANIAQLLDGFKVFAESLLAFLLVTVYIVLWSLLLIIPGIIAALSYAQVFYIMADEAGISGTEAIKKSKQMMSGYKWKLFCLGFRFFGWAILCIFTLGIGFLWLMPYAQVSYAAFYEDLKTRS